MKQSIKTKMCRRVVVIFHHERLCFSHFFFFVRRTAPHRTAPHKSNQIKSNENQPTNQSINQRRKARPGPTHGHGAAGFTERYHHSARRNEGLLEPYVASRDTFSTRRGRGGGARDQVPPPADVDPEGFLRNADQKRAKGTEIR